VHPKYKYEANMRSVLYSALLVVALVPGVSAAEIRVLTIPLFNDGISDLAAAYTKETGTTVIVKPDVIGKLIPEIQSGTPAPDVIILPETLMDTLEKNAGTKADTRVRVGRVNIALAVHAGAPHPDISTPAKFIAALRSAKNLTYTKPGPPRNSMEASIMDSMLKRPEFAGIHSTPEEKTSGIGGLLNGDGDMALQGIPEILSHKEAEVVGPLPAELGAYYDAAGAVSVRAIDEADAKAFLRYITRPEAASVWKSKGIDQIK
jgi:molybdate transport system substrate-binding protein